MSAAATPIGAAEMFDQALDAFGGALKATVRFQEDLARFWADALGQFGTIPDWQRAGRAVMDEAIPTAQKNMEEAMKIVDQNYRASIDLLKRAFESGRYESVADAQGRAQELWQASMNLLRSNVQAFAQAQTRLLETWASALSRNGADKPEKHERPARKS